MDVILHLGAHRTATTAFQTALRDQAVPLAAQGLAIWTPPATRGGLLAGVLPEPGLLAPDRQLDRARGRIAMALDRLTAVGMTRLLVSDENIIGAPRANVRERVLYPAAGFRLARHARAFGPQLRRAHLTLRPLDGYWTSVLAFAVARGAPVPGARALAAIAAQPRGWREVIRDIACALPAVDLTVAVHGDSAPAAPLAALTGGALRLTGVLPRINATPDLSALRRAHAAAGGDASLLRPGHASGPVADRWQPFTPDQAARLRETFADDLFWLRAGADGLARLVTEPNGATDPAMMTRGYHDDKREGCVA